MQMVSTRADDCDALGALGGGLAEVVLCHEHFSHRVQHIAHDVDVDKPARDISVDKALLQRWCGPVVQDLGGQLPDKVHVQLDLPDIAAEHHRQLPVLLMHRQCSYQELTSPTLRTDDTRCGTWTVADLDFMDVACSRSLSSAACCPNLLKNLAMLICCA